MGASFLSGSSNPWLDRFVSLASCRPEDFRSSEALKSEMTTSNGIVYSVWDGEQPF